jgi:hypothetical protein
VVAVQGRYFYAGLAGVAPLIVLAAAAIFRRANRWLPALFVVISLAMTLLAVEYMLSEYWSSFGSGLAGHWSGVVTSSPLPTSVSTAILVLSAASFLTLLGSAILLGLRGEPTNSLRIAGRTLAVGWKIERRNQHESG